MRELLQQCLDKFEHLWEIGIDAEYKVELLPEIRALRNELAKPEPVVLFTDNEEGLCIKLECNGAYFWENLNENKAAEFFINAYRGGK